MPQIAWSPETELVGLRLIVSPKRDSQLHLRYTVSLHAWLLQQVHATKPQLSAYLHDGESEKGFTISPLSGAVDVSGQSIHLYENCLYSWKVTALTQSFASWLFSWLLNLPKSIDLSNVTLDICDCEIAVSPQTYSELGKSFTEKSVALTFTTPTSFRHKGHHLPIPYPENVFHSYLRRWNHFSNQPVDQNIFLQWVDTNVMIRRHYLTSHKIAVGKRGSVIGFTGAVEFTLSKQGSLHSEYTRLLFVLCHLSPYCGTGVKTTFGLGQTQLGWQQQLKYDILCSSTK